MTTLQMELSQLEVEPLEVITISDHKQGTSLVTITGMEGVMESIVASEDEASYPHCCCPICCCCCCCVKGDE